jgi:hypothetical protein
MTKDRVSAHVASRVRCEAGIKCPYLIQRNKKASLQSRKRADTNFLFANENQMKRHRLHPGNCPGHSPFPELGVALVKPTTSYFWFLVTFRHNRICGLAVAFINYFLGCLPALLKIIPKTGDVGELRPNANNVIRPPPPIPPPRCNDLPCIYSFVANKAMQLNGRNTSACNCIA